MMPTAKNQQGVALITALLIAAMVAAMAMTLASRTNLWLNQTQNRQDYSSGQVIARGAIELARLTLRDDARNNQTDHLQESWTMPIPAVNAEEGKVGGRVIEMQGFFNLANLVTSAGEMDKTALEGFRRLLANIGLDPSLADKLENDLKPKAAMLARAKAAKLFPYVDLAELGEISGFDTATILRLQQYVVILPETTAVNVNFAGPEVLAAVTPELSVGDAGSIVSRRSGSHFKSVDEFVEAVPESLRGKLTRSAYTVQSTYFLVEADAWFGRVHLRYHALLARSSAANPSIVWMRRAYGAGAP